MKKGVNEKRGKEGVENRSNLRADTGFNTYATGCYYKVTPVLKIKTSWTQ